MVNFTELNKEIVLLRGDVKRARLLLIQTLCRNIRKLRGKKGNPAQLARNQHRAEKLHEDITVLKGLKPDDVTKAGLFADLDEHKVLSDPASSSKDRAMARLISHKALKSRLDTVRAKFSIIPDLTIVPEMKTTTKDKQPVNKAKKTAEKPGQGETEKRQTEKKENTQTPTESSTEKVQQTSDALVGKSSSDGESNASSVGEEDKISPTKDEARASTELPSLSEILVGSRNQTSDSDEDEEASEEEMEEDVVVDSKREEVPGQVTESSIEGRTESQVNPSQSEESDNKQSVKRTEATTVKRKGPRKAACDVEEEEEKKEEETTETEGDDMFLREGDPDPEEDTEGRKRMLDSGGSSGGQTRTLPGESLFIGSLAGGRRSRNVKKGKFEKGMGKRPKERGSSHKFAARGRAQLSSKAPGAGRMAKPSESSAHLHPSWVAKRKQKEQAGQIAAFQGKKIVFDD